MIETRLMQYFLAVAKEQNITVTTAMDMSEEVRTAQKEAGLSCVWW